MPKYNKIIINDISLLCDKNKSCFSRDGCSWVNIEHLSTLLKQVPKRKREADDEDDSKLQRRRKRRKMNDKSYSDRPQFKPNIKYKIIMEHYDLSHEPNSASGNVAKIKRKHSGNVSDRRNNFFDYVIRSIRNGGRDPKREFMPLDDLICCMKNNKVDRAIISKIIRELAEHHHEWLPCMTNAELLMRCLEEKDPRWFLLIHTLRSPTKYLIFNPEKYYATLSYKYWKPEQIEGYGSPNTIYHTLTGHTGAIKTFKKIKRRKLSRITSGRQSNSDFMEVEKYKTKYQDSFHTAICEKVLINKDVVGMLVEMKKIFEAWIWNGDKNFLYNSRFNYKDSMSNYKFWEYYAIPWKEGKVCSLDRIADRQRGYYQAVEKVLDDHIRSWSNPSRTDLS